MPATTDCICTPADAVSALVARLAPVQAEIINYDAAAGRVLAEPLSADRDSPAVAVSAMDGYAVRLCDLPAGSLPVEQEVTPGQPPPDMRAGKAIRIFTGAPVPAGADAVIRREDVCESHGHIVLQIAARQVRSGQNIRAVGENVRSGRRVLDAGELVSPAVSAALAAFGRARVKVFRRVRTAVLVTGGELRRPEDAVKPWQIRDSNGPALLSMLKSLPWVEPFATACVADDPGEITRSLAALLESADAVLLSGGVSVGNYDHVPAAVKSVAGTVLFHRLPIRPGKPILGAIGPRGQAILGLPGNPVATLVTARRFGVPVLRRLAGLANPEPPTAIVRTRPRESLSGLWWYRLVKLAAPGIAEFVRNQGAGDFVAAARSDGFVEVSPDCAEAGFSRGSVGDGDEWLPFWGWAPHP